MTDAIFYTAYDDMPPAVVRLRRGRKPRRGFRSLGALWMLAAGATAFSAIPARGPGSLHIPTLASRVLPALKVASTLPVPQRITDDPLLIPVFVGGEPSEFSESRPMSAHFVFADTPKMAVLAEAPAPAVTHTATASASEPAVSGPQMLAANDDDAETVIPSIPPSASPLSWPMFRSPRHARPTSHRPSPMRRRSAPRAGRPYWRA